MKKISVITINRNNAGGLKNTLESVKQQGAAVFEYVVIDGDSTDNSLAEIKKCSHITRFVSEPDKGIYDAMNKGLGLCTGDHIYFLNSGDVFVAPDALGKVANSPDDAAILYGNIILNDPGKTKLTPPEVLDVPYFITSTLWHPCAIVKRTVFEEYGRFDDTFRIAGDYEFFIRTILKYGVSSRYLNIDLVLFDMNGISNSSSARDTESKERRMALEKNFSSAVINSFESYTKLLRSSEYKWGKKLMKFLKPFKG